MVEDRPIPIPIFFYHHPLQRSLLVFLHNLYLSILFLEVFFHTQLLFIYNEIRFHLLAGLNYVSIKKHNNITYILKILTRKLFYLGI